MFKLFKTPVFNLGGITVLLSLTIQTAFLYSLKYLPVLEDWGCFRLGQKHLGLFVSSWRGLPQYLLDFMNDVRLYDLMGFHLKDQI